MTFYMDASALVKAYALEKGSEEIVEILNKEEDIFLSKVAFAEVLFSLRRKNYFGELKDKNFLECCRHFGEDWSGFYIVELSGNILSVLNNRVIKYPLRALDAIHLASAIWVEDILEERPIFVCADDPLNGAAKKEGFKVFNPVKI